MRRKALAVVAALATITGTLLAGTGTAQAVPDQSLIANTSPMGQTNGRVWSMAYANNVLYVGGEFTSTRPSGSPAGSNEVARGRLAAFDTRTGTLLPLNHSFDNMVRGVALSPDHKTLYVVGKFKTVDGQARGRGAAIDLATGSLTSWNPKLGDTAWSVDATSSAVYIGGVFGSASGQPRSRLAAFTPSGTLLPWAPTTDGYVRTLKVSPNGDRVIVGGGFSHLNDVTMRALGSVDPVTGANEPFPDGIIPTVAGAPTSGSCCYSEATNLSTDGQYMYVSSEGTGGGIFDGSVKFDPTNGDILWRDNCLGATQMVFPLNGAVYKASHAHDCSADEGGFPQITSASDEHHLLALDQQTGAILHWYPSMNGGPGGGLGPRVFATDGTQLFVGGEFTSVANKAQQGLARFGTSLPGMAPRKPATPAASVRSTGTVVVRFPATWDPDDATLTYDLFRNTRNGSPIATIDKSSRPYALPNITMTDTTAPAGANATYYVRVTDGSTVAWSSASNTVVGGQPATSYSAAVKGDGAELYWRLGDGTGSSTAADSSSTGANDGTYTGGTTRGVDGVLSDNTAARFNGSDGNVYENASENNPQGFSVEAWVKTTSRTGGKVVGFGNAQTGGSSNYDRHIYLTNSGLPYFGVYNNNTSVVKGTKRVNDGNWHYLVGTSDSDGITLYVDGEKVASDPSVTFAQSFQGYWRVGGDNLGGWPSQPSSSSLAGDIDEVAVYPYSLATEDVQSHYALSGYTLPPPAPVPTSCPTGQYLAKYWNNMDQSGDPVLVRCETSIDYDWGDGSPADEVANDNFSVRWTGTQSLTDGSHTFTTVSDDGIRVDVDGTRIIDNWTDHGPTTDTATVPLTAGDHQVEVNFYENGGGAVARLSIS